MSLSLNDSSAVGSIYSDDYDIDEEIAAANSSSSAALAPDVSPNTALDSPKGFTKQRRGSREFIYPAPQSHQRQSTLHGAVFNLSATILGGGILTLPFCFQLCGLVFGSFFLVAIAAASNFSIYILVSCSRRIRHGASYEEVVASTFGQTSGRMIVLIMFALVYLCIVAYTLLIRDLVTPLLELLFNTEYGSVGRFFIVSIVLLIMLPLCLQRNMSSIAWISIVSIVSMLLLAYCVIYRGIESLFFPSHMQFTPTHHSNSMMATSTASHEDMMTLKLAPSRWSDVLYAAPIFTCAYICHFNVLPLHRELIHPTRPRIKKMIYYVVTFCTALYLAIGMFGYIYARGYTDGNILNNFRTKDILATIGRIALAFTCIAGLPMIVLPARALLGKILAMVAPALVDTTPASETENAAAATTNSSSGPKQYIVYDGPYGKVNNKPSSLYGSEALDSSFYSAGSSGFHAIYDTSRRVASYDSLSSHIDRDPLQADYVSESDDDDAAAEEASFLAAMIRRAAAVAAAVGAGAGLTSTNNNAGYADLSKPSAPIYPPALGPSDAPKTSAPGLQPESAVKEVEEEYFSPIPFHFNNNHHSASSPAPNSISPSQAQKEAQAKQAVRESLQRISNEVTPLMHQQQHYVHAMNDSTSVSSTPKKLNSHLGDPNATTAAAAVQAWNRAGQQQQQQQQSQTQESEPRFSEQSIRVQTVGICFSALLCSLRISSVATLWNLLGSSVCLILGFIVPSACYLKIRKDKPLGFRMLCAWLLLIGGIVGLVVCMMESLTTLSALTEAPDASKGFAPAANDENLPTAASLAPNTDATTSTTSTDTTSP